MKILKDVCYDPAHPEMDRLDIYIPDKTENAYIYFHGGGMTHGDKLTPRTEELFHSLCEEGTLVFSANYRFLPTTEWDSAPRRTPVSSAENDVSYQEVLRDCAKAVSWALTEGRKYGEFGRVSIGGSSAGGYITMMLLFCESYLGAFGIDPKRDIDGYLFDAGQPTTHFHLLELQGESPLRVLVDESAPFYYLSKPFEEGEKLPKILTVVAEQDMPGRVDQNRLLLTTMKNFAYPAELLGYRMMMGYGHCKYLADPEYIRLSADFVRGKLPAAEEKVGV